MRLIGDDHRWLGILQHARDALRGVGGVDGYVSGADLHDAEDGDDEFGGSVEAEADGVVRDFPACLKGSR